MFMFEAELCCQAAQAGASLAPVLLSFNFSFPLSHRGLLIPLSPSHLVSPRSTEGR